MELKVKITKEIIKKAMYCITGPDCPSNCAVALAVKEIFPKAEIDHITWYPFGGAPYDECDFESKHDGGLFILKFDSLEDQPEKRLELPETVITLQITQEIIDELNKGVDWQKIVNESELLEFV